MSGPRIRPNNFDKLKDLTKQMNVPENRTGDVRWLSRNLEIKNSNHPLFEEAMGLIKELTFKKNGN